MRGLELSMRFTYVLVDTHCWGLEAEGTAGFTLIMLSLTIRMFEV